MTATQRTICAGLMLAVTACGRTLRAEEPNRDFALGVNAANATLRGGDVDGALTKYNDIRSTAPESADLSYNMAVAQYRKGEVAAAAPMFEAAATSENDSLAANARYNLGNCNFTAGLKLAESDREAAIKELESAIENYRSSLSVDTNNADARANIELAAQLIDKLREEQKQQEQQQQDQQQDQQQNQDQQQSNDEQQNDQQQQSSQGKQDEQKQDQNRKQKENEQKQNQDQQSGQQQEQNQEKQENKDSQSQSSQDGAQQQKDQDQQQEQKSKEQQNAHEQKQNEQKHSQQEQSQNQQQEQAKSQPQQNQTSQQQNSQKAQQQRPEDAGTPEEQVKEEQGQKPPQGDLSATNEEEAKKGEEQREAVAFDPAKDGEMTQQEAEKMLQAIRDRDLIRRYNRQENERQNYVPVDRDW